MKLRISVINFRPGERYLDDFASAVTSVRQPDTGISLLVFPEYTFLPALLPALNAMDPLEVVASAWSQLTTCAKRSAIEHHTHILVCGAEPSATGICNVALLFDPQGACIQRTVKVALTAWERQLGIHAGTNSDITTCELAGYRIGTAICFDAFSDVYRKQLADQQVEILLVPSANPQKWASLTAGGTWQPDEWTIASVGSLDYGAIGLVVNPMLHFNKAPLFFDGQGAIIQKTEAMHACPYVGVNKNFPVEFIYCETENTPIGYIDV